jgi:hypothetical protein
MPDNKSPRITYLILTSLVLFACGILTAPNPTPAPIQPTDTATPPTETPTRLPPPTATLQPPSPRATITTTPAPEWVTDFAEPILAEISSRPPDLEDNFGWDTDAWEISHRDVTVNWKKSLKNGEMLLTGVTVQNHSIKFYDYVVEVNIRPTRQTTDHGYGIEFSNGMGDFSGNNIVSCGIRFRNNTANSGTFFSYCVGQQFEGEITLRPAFLFRLIVKGGRIAIYVEDKPLVYYEDDRYRLYRGGAPQFYLGAGAEAIAFSNFKVWNITKLEVP